MNLRNKPPLFVPAAYVREVEALSKAALMDLVWDNAMLLCDDPNDPARVMLEFRKRAEIIMSHRRQDRMR